jgi:DNA-binding NarL/FixJ family response regulator
MATRTDLIASEGVTLAFIERREVFERASKALEDARAGRGSMVFLDGPVGTGKSALMRAIGSLAAASGMDVLLATGRPNEQGFGFGVVVQLFDSKLERAPKEERARLLSAAAGEAVPILTPGNRHVEPTFESLHGLYRVCRSLASGSGLAIFLDDADLADWQSLRFLSYLAARIEDLPVVLVLAAGSVPRSQVPELSELAEGPWTAHCSLRPLTPVGTAERVKARWPDATDDACRAIYEASGGYPSLTDDLAAEQARSRGGSKPRIATRILRCAAYIDDDAPALLTAVGVLGPACQLRHAAQVAGLDHKAAASIADLLAEAGILKVGRDLSFAQPAVGAAIEAVQAPAQRAAMHLDAAQLIRTEGAPPERVGFHLLRATRTASEWVVAALSAAAAIALARGTPDTAVAYLRRALDEPPGPQQRAHIILELGRAEAMAGEPQAADRLSEGAAEFAAEAHEQPAAALATGRTLLALGQPEQASTVFARATAEGDADPDVARRLHAGHVAANWLAGVSEGAGVSDGGPPQTGDTAGDRSLLALHAMDGAMRGLPCREVHELAVRALANGALLDDETADGLTYYLAATALVLAEDLQMAEAALTAAVEDAQTRGSVLGFATASAVRATAILRRGRLPDAASDARTALAAEQDGWLLGLAAARSALAVCLIECGDLEAAGRQLEMAEGAVGDGYPARIMLLETRGYRALEVGEADRALADFLAVGEAAEKGGAHNPAVSAWRSGAGLACAAVGDQAEAQRLIEEELALAQAFGAPGPIGRSLRAMASIQPTSAALETLEAAVETLGDSQAALERAKALVDFGAALRRSSRRRQARKPLSAGLELAQGCGAEGLAARAMREINAAGGRPRRTALTGLNSLTVRERQVASLAAEGLSNRQIAETLVVTVKTVEWHLKHSYRKLGVESRRRLREFFVNEKI